MRTVLRFVLAAVLGFVVWVPLSAYAEDALPTWSIGLGGGWAGRYKYRTDPPLFGGSPDEFTFDPTWMATFRVGRRLGTLTSLQSGIDYFEQEDPGMALSVRMGCLSVGLRKEFNRDQRARPYVELLPAVFVGEWTDELTSHSATNPRPGLVAGAGIVGPVIGRFSVDFGIKGHFSTEWPSVGHSPYDAPTYHGVKRVTLGGNLVYAP